MELFSDERNALRIVFAQRGKGLAGVLENGIPVFSLRLIAKRASRS